MNDLAYKANLDATLSRLQELHERRATDRVFAVFQVPNRRVARFRDECEGGYVDYPDPAARIRFWDEVMRETSAIEDDSVPNVYPTELDQGLYGGLLGGEVRFLAHPENGWISSMVMPLLKDWSGFSSLRFDESHPWMHRYLRQLEIFAEGSRGKFGISHFILIDSLNFVFELLGATATYWSLIDYPDEVKRAIDFAFDLNVRVQDIFFEKVPMLRGGTCSNMVQWIPGRILTESVDPFHMTSAADFEKWGREPVERIFRRFDGGVLHLHGNGRHLLEAVCTIPGLKAIHMGDDKGFPRTFETLAELRKRGGDMPLVARADFAEFRDGLRRDTLQGGVLYHVHNAPAIDEVNRLMEEVRAYRL